MKARIKALKGKTVRLFWGTNEKPYNAVGMIKKLYRVQFDFRMNGEILIKVRYENVTNAEEI